MSYAVQIVKPSEFRQNRNLADCSFTSLFGTEPRKNHSMMILMFFYENENNDVKEILLYL